MTERQEETTASILERLETLEAEITLLRRENARLQEENAELRRRLGLNSQNSHKPPSSDGYAKKRTKPALPKMDKKPLGGQPGHQGRTLQAVALPDKAEVHLPEECAVCHRKFGSQEAHRLVSKRQVFDLPEPRLEVTEHWVGEITCCGQAQSGKFPSYVGSSVQYGPGVGAWATKLSVDHKLPLAQISQLFEDLYGYDLNSETIESALEMGYRLVEPLEATIVEALRQAETAHFDETGLRVNGKLQWLHTACNVLYTHLFVHEKRGEEALRSESSALKDFCGWTVHDHLAAYYRLTNANHAACSAHILCELQGLVERGSQWAGQMHAFLLELYRTQRRLVEEEAEEARKRYRDILSVAEQEEPLPEPKIGRGRPKCTPGRNLLRRLCEKETAVLAFALHEGVPFTNTQAERDLRPAKVKQKVTGGFRTVQGARVYARLQAVISTCRKQERNVFLALRNLFSHQIVSLVAG